MIRSFFGFFTGFATTLRECLRRPATVAYPEERPFVSRRWRGVHGLFRTASGEELCVACHLCARSCPSRCISLEGQIDERGVKTLTRFDVDLTRCIHCGYCEEVCPVDAIRLTTSSDYVARQRADLVLHKEDLLAIGSAALARGEAGALGRRRGDETRTLNDKFGLGTEAFVHAHRQGSGPCA